MLLLALNPLPFPTLRSFLRNDNQLAPDDTSDELLSAAQSRSLSPLSLFKSEGRLVSPDETPCCNADLVSTGMGKDLDVAGTGTDGDATRALGTRIPTVAGTATEAGPAADATRVASAAAKDTKASVGSTCSSGGAFALRLGGD